MCGRARLSSDVSEIKVAFRIPPDRPTPNFAASWNVAPTDPLLKGSTIIAFETCHPIDTAPPVGEKMLLPHD